MSLHETGDSTLIGAEVPEAQQAEPADRDTIDAYIVALNWLMIIEDVPAWAQHMRSATPLRKSATRYLVDPSLGVAALGVGPQQPGMMAAGQRWRSG